MAKMIPVGLATLALLVGTAGTLLPGLPGLPLMGLAVLAYGWWEGFAAISPGYLAFVAGLIALAMAGEHWARAWGTRRFGGTAWGAWGAVAGSILGLFFLPLGLVAGPFAGAVAGELLAGRRAGQALRAGVGGVVGVLVGTGLNLAAALVILLTFLYRALGGG
ncbi:MAG: DUF456 family protein [Bacillota bacterium]|nr:MAG: DUF456 domain-containing protein [Bacillota bacterium]